MRTEFPVDPQLEGFLRREGTAEESPGGAAPSRGFCREIFWVGLSVTFTFLFPGPNAEFQVDVVDSKGSLKVQLPKEITTEGNFQRSGKPRIKIPEYWIPQ